MAAGQECDAHAADEIGRAVHAGKGGEDLARALQIVDEHHGLGAIPAEIVAERRALPIDLLVARVLGVEGPFAIAQPGNEGAARLLAQDIAVRLAGALEGEFDGLGETHGYATEETMAGLLDLVHGEAAMVLGLGRYIGPLARIASLRRWLIGPTGAAVVCRGWRTSGARHLAWSRMWRDHHRRVVGLGEHHGWLSAF